MRNPHTATREQSFYPPLTATRGSPRSAAKTQCCQKINKNLKNMLASAEGRTFHSKTFRMKNNFNHIHALHFKVKVFQMSTWQSRRVDIGRASLVAQLDPWVGKIPWRRAWQPTLVFLPGESPWTEEPGGLQSMSSQRVGHGSD